MNGNRKKNTRYDQADYSALRNGNICKGEGMNFDSTEQASVFFARELDYVKSQSYDVEYPEMTQCH